MRITSPTNKSFLPDYRRYLPGTYLFCLGLADAITDLDVTSTAGDLAYGVRGGFADK